MGLVKKTSESKNMKLLAKQRGKHKYLCNAPFTSISVAISGLVTPCCYMGAQTSAFSQGASHFPTMSLIDIWNGKKFEYFRKCMQKNIFPDECAICSNAVQSGNTFSVKLLNYDVYIPDGSFPQLLEIAPDNTCNLRCIMCSSLNSSAIARSRGCYYPENSISAEKYLQQLEPFIPHLKEIVVSGGEPFFSELSMSIMQHVVEKNHGCMISVNTNATILTDAVKRLLDKGNFKLNISLDSLQKEAYESIRRGADFEEVIQNIDYFSEYSKKNKRPLSIAVCPLQTNYSEMPELLGFCNEKGFYVFYLHVFNAQKLALASANEDVLEQALAEYKQFSPPENNLLEKQNAQQFRGLVANMESWLAFAGSKKRILSTLISNEEYYREKKNQLFSSVYSLIQHNTPDDLQVKRFKKWTNKTHELFDSLPQYYRSKALCDVVFAISPELYLLYVEKFSTVDLHEYFISFGDEAIAALTQ